MASLFKSLNYVLGIIYNVAIIINNFTLYLNRIIYAWAIDIKTKLNILYYKIIGVMIIKLKSF